jgi:hypothetical protein
LACCFLLQGCAADEYAAQLSALLKTYSAQVSRRLAEEEKRYRREAKILQDADDDLQNLDVDEAIATAAQGLARDIRNGAATGDRAIAAAAAFGQTEFERARLTASRGQDSELQRIRALQSLQADSAKIEGLRAALEGLAKKPNWQAALGESAQFGVDTKNHFDLLSCRDLHEMVKQLEAQARALASETATDAAAREELARRRQAVNSSLKSASEGRQATGRFDAATQSCH